MRLRQTQQHPWILRADSPTPFAFDLSDQVEILQAAAGEDGKPAVRKMKIRAYNGGVMVPRMPGVPIVVDLAGSSVETDPTPSFRDHDPAQVLGQGTVSIAAAAVDFEGTFCGPGQHVDPILEAADKGFRWKSSLGANLFDVEWIAAGQTAKANGKTFKGPVYIARRSVITEVTITARGADTRTSVRIAATAAKGNTMPPEFVAWLKACGIDQQSLSEEQLANLQNTWKASLKASGSGGDDPADPPADPPTPANKQANAGDPLQAMADRAAAEQERQAEILALEAEPKFQFPGAKKLIAQGIRERWDVTRAKLELLQASYDKAPTVHGGGSGTAIKMNAAAMECALLMACHVMPEEKLLKAYGEKTLEAAGSRHLRGASIQTLMIACVQAAGMHVVPGAIRESDFDVVVEANRRLQAQAMDQRMQASGEISTLSLTGILSNVANKALLEAFESFESAVSAIAAETDTNDFKAFTRYRLDSTGSFGEVGADGELKHIKLVESSYTNQLKTEGGIFGLNRQTMINDDLGAFLQLPTLFGELAKHAREQTAFAKLLANAGNFFHANNKNLITGSGSALGIDAISAARTKFRNMKGPGGRFILMSPQQLLVPPALETLAGNIYASEYVNETTTANAPKAVNNPHRNKYAPVVSPYLGTESGLTGSSDTAWYLTVKPSSSIAILQVAYLRGRRAPVIESSETAFNTLGMQWRSYFDFGVNLFEPRAGVKNAGA